jgi:hypothetical protein
MVDPPGIRLAAAFCSVATGPSVPNCPCGERRAFHFKKVDIFNLQGQAAFKRRFRGDEVPTYIASRRRSPMEKLALLRLIKTL